MALQPRYGLGLVLFMVLAGCAAGLPGIGEPTPESIEAKIVGVSSSGGRCVDEPMHGMAVASRPDDGARIVTIAGNATVSAANFVLDETNLTPTGPNTYRLDVNTSESDQKPDRPCPDGGIVHYEVTLQVPSENTFELEIRHDGVPVTGIGGGGES